MKALPGSGNFLESSHYALFHIRFFGPLCENTEYAKVHLIISKSVSVLLAETAETTKFDIPQDGSHFSYQLQVWDLPTLGLVIY